MSILLCPWAQQMSQELHCIRCLHKPESIFLMLFNLPSFIEKSQKQMFRSGTHRLLKNRGATPKNPRYHIKQVPYCGPTNIRYYHTNLDTQDLCPLLQVLTMPYSFQIHTLRKHRSWLEILAVSPLILLFSPCKKCGLFIHIHK